MVISKGLGQHKRGSYAHYPPVFSGDGVTIDYTTSPHPTVYLSESGFLDQDSVTISFVDGTRTFTIEPVSTNFSFCCHSQIYIKEQAETVVISDVEGIHYIYYEDGGILTSSQSIDIIDLIKYNAWVSTLYWDATNGISIILCNEVHGRMDWRTHAYLHETVGCRWVSGLDLDNYVLGGSGTLDSSAQLSITDGVIRDEDIRFSITDDSPQNLDPISYIPLLYRSGVNGYWRKITATTFPLTTTGTGNAAWNEDTGSTWQLSEVTSTDYVCVHLIATTDIRHPIIGVLGQATYNNADDAEVGAVTELSSLKLGSLLLFSLEWKPIYTLVFLTNSANTNGVKSTLENFIDWRLN